MRKLITMLIIVAVAGIVSAQYTPMTRESDSTVSGALTVTGNLEVKGLKVTQAAYTAAGAIDVTKGFAYINGTGGLAMTIAAPVAGQWLVITSNAQTNTVTLTAGTYDGTNEIATFNAAGETLVLFGISATRWVIVENIGSVGLSTD